MSSPSLGLLFLLMALIFPKHDLIFLVLPYLRETRTALSRHEKWQKAFEQCFERLLYPCLIFFLRAKVTTCNSTPDFSDFNLISTLLSFLTTLTRLLHPTRSLMGAPGGLQALLAAISTRGTS